MKHKLETNRAGSALQLWLALPLARLLWVRSRWEPLPSADWRSEGCSSEEPH
jgi:hypothetical protein